MPVDPKFIIDYRGRNFILYAGILELAHEQGVQSIATHIVQIPEEKNQNVAIVTAVVTMKNGSVFSGIGDASKSNVASAISNALLRMAETRAKARALRDATNVGITAFEEISGDEPHPETVKQTPLGNLLTAEWEKAGLPFDNYNFDVPRAAKLLLKSGHFNGEEKDIRSLASALKYINARIREKGLDPRSWKFNEFMESRYKKGSPCTFLDLDETEYIDFGAWLKSTPQKDSEMEEH
jgi:hypothetical protein